MPQTGIEQCDSLKNTVRKELSAHLPKNVIKSVINHTFLSRIAQQLAKSLTAICTYNILREQFQNNGLLPCLLMLSLF